MSLTRWVLCVALLLLPALSHAAISYVSVTNSVTSNISQTSMTTADTVNAGEALIIAIQVRGSAAGAAVSSVTWNTSESCTVAKTQVQGAGPTYRSELWYCATPTATAANVVVTWENANNNQAQSYSIVHVTGMATASPVDAMSGAGGTGTTMLSTITTSADNVLVVDSLYTQTDVAANVTVGSGQTSRVKQNVGGGGTVDTVGVSTMVKTPPGAEVEDWTTSTAGQTWVHAAASFLPSGGAAPPPQSPTTATLFWKNGTDNVGVTTATIKRCAGSSCTPTTTVTVVPATSATSQSFVDATLAANTTYNWSVCNGDQAGNQSSCTLFTSGATTGTTYRRVLGTSNFTAADGADIGTDFDDTYTTFGPAKIVSQRVRPTTINLDAVETYNAVATPNDQWVQYTVPTLTGAVAANANVLVRFANSPTANGYLCAVAINPTSFTIFKQTGVVYVQLGTQNTTATYLPTDIYRCEAQGTTLRFFQVRGTAETLLTSTTDATYASGKTGIDLFVATAGNLANVELDNFAMGDFTTTPPTPPTIDAVTVDATGANVTWNVTTPPTQIRVDCGNNTRTYINDTQPLSSFPAGRYTRSWLNGLTFCGFHAINNLGIETTLPTSAYQYKSMTSIVGPLDTTPPVVSGCLPSTDLPFGTTSYTMTCVIDKPAQCAYDSTDIAYSSMTGAMTTAGFQCSATISGLTNGSTTTKYVRAQSADSLDGLYPTTTSQTVTLHVLSGAGADTTAPTTVANLVAALDASGQVATLTWTAATDAGGIAGYQVYQSTDACVTPIAAGDPVTTTSTQLNLVPSTAYCWTVKAVDTSNNVSAAMSNQATLTTSAILDVVPPSTMGTITLVPFKNSFTLTWPDGTDDSGSKPTASLEYCTVMAPSTDCSNFQQFVSLLLNTSLDVGLASNTSYCFRGRFSDPSQNAGSYSAVVCGTTRSAGITQQRQPVNFNSPRLPRTP